MMLGRLLTALYPAAVVAVLVGLWLHPFSDGIATIVNPFWA